MCHPVVRFLLMAASSGPVTPEASEYSSELKLKVMSAARGKRKLEGSLSGAILVAMVEMLFDAAGSRALVVSELNWSSGRTARKGT